MNIAIDIGNTEIKAAQFSNFELIEVKRFRHDETQLLHDWVASITPKKIGLTDVAGISKNWPEDLFLVPITRLTAKGPFPITIEYATPETLGLDRIALAVAAWNSRGNSSAVLAISCGTCLTFEYVFAQTYKGGAISPGLSMRLKAMHTQTGKLPLLEPENELELIGNTTKLSMLSGAYHGMLQEITARIDLFLAANPRGRVFLTGGDSFRFVDAVKNPIFADNFLPVKGINQILEYQLQA